MLSVRSPAVREGSSPDALPDGRGRISINRTRKLIQMAAELHYFRVQAQQTTLLTIVLDACMIPYYSAPTSQTSCFGMLVLFPYLDLFFLAAFVRG